MPVEKGVTRPAGFYTDQGILEALKKAKGISAPPPGPGERLLGQGLGTLTDNVARSMTEGMFSEEPGPLDVLAAVPLGLPKMIEVLTKGAADRMLRGSSSVVLRGMRENGLWGHGIRGIEDTIGSSYAARVASGLPISGQHGTALGKSGFTRYDTRAAQEELYRISQALLDEMGIPSHESVRVFRGGPVRTPGQFLNPTSAESWVSEQFNPMVSEFEVPRTSIRALPGVLARGDNVTLSEMLVPGRTLLQSRVGGAPLTKGSGNFVVSDLEEIPARLRRLVAQMKANK